MKLDDADINPPDGPDEPDDEPPPPFSVPSPIPLPFFHPVEIAHESDDEQIKRLGGRPSKYRPEYGAALVKLMAQGFSLNAASAKLGLLKDTAADWAASVPEFSELLSLAKGLRSFHLENLALNSPKISSAQASIYLRALSRANPADYGEALSIEHGAVAGELRDAIYTLGRELHERLVASSHALVEGDYVTVGEEDVNTAPRTLTNQAEPSEQKETPEPMAPGSREIGDLQGR